MTKPAHNTADDDGTTPLHHAAQKGYVKICKIIAQSLPSGHRNPDSHGCTPRDLAIKSYRRGKITLDTVNQIKALCESYYESYESYDESYDDESYDES